MANTSDTEKRYDIASHAALPMLLMLFIQMSLNFYAATPNTLFLSPYLLAFLGANILLFFVLWKGEICPGQEGRLIFVLKFFLIFALGHFAYVISFTPKYIPLNLSAIAALMLSFIYWKVPNDKNLLQTAVFCGFGIATVSLLLYLLVYWIEIPSIFNGIRANNFAQLLLAVLLAGWYLMLAKSRLDGFFKLLVKLALILLVLNYIWTALMLYYQLTLEPELALMPYALYLASQLILCGILAWLLLGKGEKQIKNPIGWTAALFLGMLYPFVNAF